MGQSAKRIGDYMQTHGGLLAAEDLARFHARVGAPVKADYHGYEIYKAGFWTQGPAMVETLNLLDGYDLKAMGHNSADYIHTLTESLKLALADRDRYYGDPDFVKIPMGELLVERLRRAAPIADRKAARVSGAATRRSAEHEGRARQCDSKPSAALQPFPNLNAPTTPPAST